MEDSGPTMALQFGQRVRVRTTGQKGVVADVLTIGNRPYLVNFDQGGVDLFAAAALERLPNRETD